MRMKWLGMNKLWLCRVFGEKLSKILVAFFASVVLMVGATVASAHEIRPTIANLDATSGDGLTLELSANLEALIAEIGAEHDDTSQSPNASRYDALRAMPPEELRRAFEAFSPSLLGNTILSINGEAVPLSLGEIVIPDEPDLDLPRISSVTLNGSVPEGGQTFVWSWPEQFGQSVIRVVGVADAENPEQGYSAFLRAGERSEEIPLTGGTRSFFEVVNEYIYLGFTHILPKGLDHILFVVGLFLLSTKLSTLLWQVTSFTIAHSITLALGMLGYIQLSPAIVEPLIAASIVYICVENIMTDKLQSWRPFVIFAFGLLHGLGFAGVLAELGMAPGEFATSLVAFNIGVELGQLTVIALCFLAVGFWFQSKTWYRQAITIPASLVIAAIGAWWVVERTLLS